MVKVFYQYKGSRILHHHTLSSDMADTLIKHQYRKLAMFFCQGAYVPVK